MLRPKGRAGLPPGALWMHGGRHAPGMAPVVHVPHAAGAGAECDARPGGVRAFDMPVPWKTESHVVARAFLERHRHAADAEQPGAAAGEVRP